MNSAQDEFERMTEAKRQREEAEEADAETKAKEAEYNDMRATVDDAKEVKDAAETAFKTAETAFNACNVDNEDCGDLEESLNTARQEKEWAEEDYGYVKEAFDSVNAELRAKEEAKYEKVLEQQRTDILNMVQDDKHFIEATADTMLGRIDWIKNHIEDLSKLHIFEGPIPEDEIRAENFAGQWENKGNGHVITLSWEPDMPGFWWQESDSWDEETGEHTPGDGWSIHLDESSPPAQDESTGIWTIRFLVSQEIESFRDEGYATAELTIDPNTTKATITGPGNEPFEFLGKQEEIDFFRGGLEPQEAVLREL